MPFSSPPQGFESGVPLFSPNEGSSFPLSRLQKISAMEKSHFWFRGRETLIEKIVQEKLSPSAKVIDFGCGTGRIVEKLAEKQFQAVGLDLRKEGLIELKKRRPDLLLVQANAEAVPFLDSSFDAALLLDLLEHVDDKAVLKEACRLVRPGGLILLTVPAHSWLWSERDELAGHRRRYSKKQLRNLLNTVALQVEEIGYYHCFLFPFFIFSRILSRWVSKVLDLEERSSSPLLTKIALAEARLARRISLPIGSTLFAIGKR